MRSQGKICICSFKKETLRIGNNKNTEDTHQVVRCIEYFIDTQKHIHTCTVL